MKIKPIWFPSILPFSMPTSSLISGLQGSAGAVHHRSNRSKQPSLITYTPSDNSVFRNLTCIFLNCRREPGEPGEKPHSHKENRNCTERRLRESNPQPFWWEAGVAFPALSQNPAMSSWFKVSDVLLTSSREQKQAKYFSPSPLPPAPTLLCGSK